MEHVKKYSALVFAFIAVIFWASAFAAVKFSLDFYSPETIMLMRFLIASLILAVYCLITKTKLPEKRDLPLFAVCGFIGIFSYMWLFNTGTGLVTSGLSSFIIAACPVFTLILSVIFLKERPGLKSWLGILISLSGLIIIAATEVSGVKLNFGVVILIAAAICTSAYNILQRSLLKKYSAMQSTSFVVFFATAFMCVFLPKLVNELPSAPASPFIVAVYLGVFPATLSYVLWGKALSLAEKTVHVTSFLYLSPFLASVIGFVMLGERLNPAVLLGGIIIITGMVITNSKKQSLKR